MNPFEKKRNSLMELNEVYFWTATVYNWNHLLQGEDFKNIIIHSLEFLSMKNKIAVYGFVIMPNHVHIIWEMLDMNGKEKSYASFLKYTAHKFLEHLRNINPPLLEKYLVDEATRLHRFWQRDPLAIRITSREMLQQKLNYCHNNPLQEHWNLATEPEAYYYSSAYDYRNNMKRFTFLRHYFDRV